MKEFRLYSIVLALFSICLTTTSPLFSHDSENTHMFEYLDLEEENPSEKEESKEELVDDELNNNESLDILYKDSKYSIFGINYFESPYHIFRGIISPPPEQG